MAQNPTPVDLFTVKALDEADALFLTSDDPKVKEVVNLLKLAVQAQKHRADNTELALKTVLNLTASE